MSRPENRASPTTGHRTAQGIRGRGWATLSRRDRRRNHRRHRHRHHRLRDRPLRHRRWTPQPTAAIGGVRTARATTSVRPTRPATPSGPPAPATAAVTTPAGIARPRGQPAAARRTDSTAGTGIRLGAAVFVNEINPGNQARRRIVFDVPKGTSIVKLELHDSAFPNGVEVRV